MLFHVVESLVATREHEKCKENLEEANKRAKAAEVHLQHNNDLAFEAIDQMTSRNIELQLKVEYLKARQEELGESTHREKRSFVNWYQNHPPYPSSTGEDPP